MRKIIITGSAATVGTDFARAYLVQDDAPETELEELALEAALNNAESFGQYLYPDEYTEDDEDLECYYDASDFEGTWSDYDPEIHDELRVGGGSFEEDFEWMMKH